MAERQYDDSDILALSERDHVRMRVNVYLGPNVPTTVNIPVIDTSGAQGKFEIKTVEFVPAAVKAVGEVIDNAVDEMTLHGTANPNRHIQIGWSEKNGRCIVSDNGRGVPIGTHATGRPTPEVVFGSFRTGRNFKDDDRTAGVMGVNGVGSSATNCCSTEFKVSIKRDGQLYEQTFSNGMAEKSEPTYSKLARGQTKVTGTTVDFTLDPAVFKQVNIPKEVFYNRAFEIAFNNPGITTTFTDLDSGDSKVFNVSQKGGFGDIFKMLGLNGYGFKSQDMEFWVAFDYSNSIDEQMFTWVNSSPLYDGGSCNTQFINAFSDIVCENLAKEAKRVKCELSRNDVRHGLLVFGLLKLKSPSYDSQAKTRLVGPNIRKEIDALITDNWASFNRASKDWQQAVIERAMRRTNASATRNAEKAAKKFAGSIPNLVDATSSDRSKCVLYILEGLSAAGPLIEVRDPETIATYPLGGKINNVYGASVGELMKMGKLTQLLLAIGLVPGKKAIRSQLRYDRIVIATDADTDGGDIFTTLVCLFYTAWPELFQDKNNPFIYRLVAPNIAAVKGKQRIHFPTRGEFEAVASKYQGWAISYYKGLGSLVIEDWEMMVGNARCYIPIYDDGELMETLKLLFSDDVNARKAWLSS